MRDWISVDEQLPQDGEPVWIRLSRWTQQGMEPPLLLDGHFRIHPTLGACFNVGPYGSICYLSTVWAGHGLNYWQPKTANEHPAPDPHLDGSTKPNQSPRPKLGDKQRALAVDLYLQKERSVGEICQLVGISRPTLYAYVRQAGAGFSRHRAAGEEAC